MLHLISRGCSLQLRQLSLDTGAELKLRADSICVHGDKPSAVAQAQGVRDALQQVLSTMPETTLVGLVTYGTMVHVHELGFPDFPKQYVFRGDSEYSSAQVAGLLGARVQSQQRGAAPQQHAASRFLVPYAECEFQISSALDELPVNGFERAAGNREGRATGAALSVAAGLVAATMPGAPAPVSYTHLTLPTKA